MGKANLIELPDGEQISILYEDRTVLAIDKPRGWILAPSSWQNTARNLQLAITSSLEARDYWARCRNLKYLRFIHRLDADTSGVLLFAKNAGVVGPLGAIFESRRTDKDYLAVVLGQPPQDEWSCEAKIGPDPARRGRMKVDPGGKDALTRFKVLQRKEGTTLIQARPKTGRTHQIRLHLVESGFPLLGDSMYGGEQPEGQNLALRAVRLGFYNPFTHRWVEIKAPRQDFLAEYGFAEMPETQP